MFICANERCQDQNIFQQFLVQGHPSHSSGYHTTSITPEIKYAEIFTNIFSYYSSNRKKNPNQQNKNATASASRELFRSQPENNKNYF